MSEHLCWARRGDTNYVYEWIRALLLVDQRPLVSVVERHRIRQKALVAERRWVQRLRRHGVNLLNMTDGGAGVSNLVAESRRKISQGLKGTPSWCKGLTKETDARVMERGKAIGAALKGKSTWPKGLTAEDDDRIARRARNLRRTFMSGNHSNSKLTVSDVRFIRAHPHMKTSDLAHRFGVTTALIGMVHRRKIWKDVT